MKTVRTLGLFLLLINAVFAVAQNIPLGETVTVHMFLTSPTTGNTTTADSGAGPRCDVFKDASTSPVAALGAVATSISGLTTSGGYLFSVVTSVGNGFSAGEFVNIDCHAVVGGVSGSIAKYQYRVVAAENTTGVQVADATLINNVSTSSVTTIAANLGTTQPLNFTGTGASATVKGDLVNIAGSTVSTSTAQLGVNVVNAAGTAWGSGAITAASIATDAIGAAEIASDAIGSDELATGAIAAAEIAADAIGASELATDAIGAAEIASAAIAADEIAADAIGASELAADSITSSEIATDAIGAAEIAAGAITSTEATSVAAVTGNVSGTVNGLTVAGIAQFFTTNSLVTYGSSVAGSVVKEIADNSATSATLAIRTGTADSGTTTTLVDAALTEADADYWVGNIVCFTSSTIDDQCRYIEDFNAGTDTITFAPATTQAVSTHNYAIYPFGNNMDVVLANHVASGSVGEGINAAAGAGDPWVTALPGAYTTGQAGKIIGSILFDAATTVGTINTNVSAALTRLPAALTSDGNMKSDTLRLGGTLQTGADVGAIVTTINSDTDNLQTRLPAALTADSNIKADTLRVNGTAQTAGDIVGTYLSLMQTLQKGVAFANYPVFMRQSGTASTGVTGATLTCTKAITNGAGWSSFSSTGISNITEIGNGYYSIDLSSAVIGNASVIRCTATGGSGTADTFINVIFGQQ